MPRSGVSTSELLDVLKKSGLPFDNSQTMRQSTPFARDPIEQTVRSQDTITPQIKAQKMAQLDKIAQMDKRLAGVYSDPSSKLYIENPMAREQIRTGAENVGYKETGRIDQMMSARQDELDRSIDDALSLYKEITTATASAEVASKKGSKSKTKSNLATKQKQLADDLTEAAQIFNPPARDFFLTLPTAFQKDWIRKVLEGQLDLESDIANAEKRGMSVTDDKYGGFQMPRIYAEYETWKGMKDAPGGTSEKKSTTGGSSRDYSSLFD